MKPTLNPLEVLTRPTLTPSLVAPPHIVEPDQINILASTMFRDLEQVQNAKESRLARQFRSNIWKPYRLNRIDFNLAFLHTVSRAHSDAGTHPDAHAASDFSPPYSLAKSFSECHVEVVVNWRWIMDLRAPLTWAVSPRISLETDTPLVFP